MTTAYQQDAVRATVITQQRSGNTVTVSVGRAAGTYNGAPISRNNVVQIVLPEATAISVTVNRVPLTRQPTETALEAAERGWTVAGGLIVAKSGTLDVREPTTFEVLVSQSPGPKEARTVAGRSLSPLPHPIGP